MLSLSKIATYAACVGIALAAVATRPAVAQSFESMPGFGPEFGPNFTPDGGCTCPGDAPSYSYDEPGYDRYSFEEPGFGPDAFDEPGTNWGPGAPDNPFNEAYSFADDADTMTEPPALPGTPGEQAFDQPFDQPFNTAPAADQASLLVGTWAWQGQVEGMPARIQTAFYRDGTYESHAATPIFELYEAGYWALVDGVLSAQVVDYAPRFVETPYGRQPMPIETFYETYLSFIDEDTVETDIGISYRID